MPDAEVTYVPSGRPKPQRDRWTCAVQLLPDQRFDFEDVAVFGAQRAQRRSQLEHVLDVRAARAATRQDLLDDRAGARRSEVVFVVGGGDVQQRRHAVLGFAGQRGRDSVSAVASLLAVIEGFENGLGGGRCDLVGDSVAQAGRVSLECHDPAGTAGNTAVVGRTLPEAAPPSFDARRTAFGVFERRSPDQRTVSEDPQRVGGRQRFRTRRALRRRRLRRLLGR